MQLEDVDTQSFNNSVLFDNDLLYFAYLQVDRLHFPIFNYVLYAERADWENLAMYLMPGDALRLSFVLSRNLL